MTKVAQAKSGSPLIPGIFLAAAFLFQAGLNTQLRSMEVAVVQPAVGYHRRWDPKVFRILSFGHLQVAVDWLWLELLIDPEIDHVPKGMHPSFYYVADFVTDLDPAFFEAYRVGANILSVIRDDGIGARDLLLKARRFAGNDLASYPESFRDGYWRGAWNLSMLLAYVYLFDLNDMPHASEAFQEAASQPGAPKYLLHLSERLKAPGGEYEVGIKLLGFMADQATDNRVKERLEKQRAALYISQYFFDLNRLFREFLGREPAYHASGKVEFRKLNALWLRFMREKRTLLKDPWGGAISLDASGRIVTTTQHEKVLGLE